jgi:DHA1 family tetracycline resistance protein-like MFS transporter
MSRKIIPVLLLSFVNTIGFSIVMPILPFLVEKYGGGPVLYGVLLSVFSLFQFVGSPMLGTLSDIYGRKPILLVSHFGTFLGWLIFVGAFYLPDIRVAGGVALPLLGIALARAVDGITGGNMSVASAYLSDSVEPKDRPKAFGTMGAVFGFGMLIGPVMGGAIAATSFGYAGVGAVSALISLVTVVLTYAWLPESLPPSKRSHDPSLRLSKRMNVLARVAHYAQDREVKNLFLIRVLFSVGFIGYVSIFIFHAIRFFHLDEMQSARFLLFTGSFLIVNQFFAVRWFVNRFGDAATFSLGQAFMVAALTAMSLTHSLPVFVVFYYFLNLGVSLSMATFKSLLIHSVSERQRGEVMGIEEALTALVQAVVPVLAGLLYAWIGIASFAGFALTGIAVFLTIYLHSKSLVLRLAPQEA